MSQTQYIDPSAPVPTITEGAQAAFLAPEPVRVDNLIVQTEYFVSQAIQRFAQGEQGYAYGVSLTVVPDSAPGGFVPVLVVVLTGPSPIIGERTFANLISFDVHPDQAGVDHIVAQGLEQIRAQRSEALAHVTAQGAATV